MDKIRIRERDVRFEFGRIKLKIIMEINYSILKSIHKEIAVNFVLMEFFATIMEKIKNDIGGKPYIEMAGVYQTIPENGYVIKIDDIVIESGEINIAYTPHKTVAEICFIMARFIEKNLDYIRTIAKSVKLK